MTPLTYSPAYSTSNLMKIEKFLLLVKKSADFPSLKAPIKQFVKGHLNRLPNWVASFVKAEKRVILRENFSTAITLL
jgi:hypothetical protein